MSIATLLLTGAAMPYHVIDYAINWAKDNEGSIRALFLVPKVDVKSTVGAGDSMVAGIVLYLSLGKDLYEAVQYGLACGTAATMNPGTELCRKADADSLFRQIKKMNAVKT